MRRVEPMHANRDHRISDGTELFDRVMGLGEDPLDTVRFSSELAHGALELQSRLFDARASELIGHVTRVARPKHRNLVFHVLCLARSAPEYRSFPCRPARRVSIQHLWRARTPMPNAPVPM